MSLFETQASPGRSSGGSWVLILAGVVVVACGAAGYLLQSSRHAVADVAPFSASGFDINYVPAPATARPAAPVQDAAPAPVVAAAPPVESPRPLPPSRAPAAAAAPAAPTGALAQCLAIFTSPAKFLVAKTYFGSPAKLKGFLADTRRMGYYMANPITREALGSPTLVKLLARPAVAHAFIASPAMSDDGAVTALARSPLLVQVMKSPGVQEALADPALVSGLMQDPQIAQWLGQHPSATVVLGQAGPALAS